MQRGFLLCALLAVFGLGVSTAARAQWVTPFSPFDHFTLSTLSPGMGHPFLFQPLVRPFAVAAPVVVQPRWQVVVTPGPGPNTSFVILQDTLLGASYLLRANPLEPSGYSWEYLPRGGRTLTAFIP